MCLGSVDRNRQTISTSSLAWRFALHPTSGRQLLFVRPASVGDLMLALVRPGPPHALFWVDVRRSAGALPQANRAVRRHAQQQCIPIFWSHVLCLLMLPDTAYMCISPVRTYTRHVPRAVASGHNRAWRCFAWAGEDGRYLHLLRRTCRWPSCVCVHMCPRTSQSGSVIPDRYPTQLD
ncbi:hypothetical protein GGS23DRAFT_554175 [Durotheca rogersii]|uniref:uncharacterized protein n=1 Tax=Durotheca rogersii TaxID=419775 RepID=UPI002220C57C|nr:uncharacterized protein GGS23DRAFT_554175 [Durotheca rogersii]KAI5865794.1 hypothetical protein GGS23DRAFT_554175 [Durotheca rogersii]